MEVKFIFMRRGRTWFPRTRREGERKTCQVTSKELPQKYFWIRLYLKYSFWSQQRWSCSLFSKENQSSLRIYSRPLLKMAPQVSNPLTSFASSSQTPFRGPKILPLPRPSLDTWPLSSDFQDFKNSRQVVRNVPLLICNAMYWFSG